MRSGLPSQGEPPSSIAAMLQGFVVVSGAGRAMLALLRLAPATTALGLLASTESPRLTSSVRESGARPDLSPHLQPPLLSMWSVRNATLLGMRTCICTCYQIMCLPCTGTLLLFIQYIH
jgi:hypothetical protein